MADFAIVNGVINEFGGKVLLAVFFGQLIFGLLSYVYGIFLGYRRGIWRGREVARRREARLAVQS